MIKINKEQKSHYFERYLFNDLKKWIDRKEIFAIKGPRQSGKTTLLRMLQEWLEKEKGINPKNIIFITFEDREILEKFSKSPKEFVKSFIGSEARERFYFLIDEFHYLEDGGQKLKLLYDLFDNVKFIITGSSSLELTGKTAKFLVGRIFSFHLWQFSFGEFVNVKSQQLYNVYRERSKLIKNFIYNGGDFSVPGKDIFSKDFEKLFEEYNILGGYPEVLKTDDEETKRLVLKNIFDTYISRDIIELLKFTDYSKFKTILSLLAVQIGNLINYNNLAADSKSYFKEVKNYLSILEETFVISLLKPFFTNKASELKKNPKAYFIDLGLRNYLLSNFNDLSLRTDAGQIVENTIFSQLKMDQEDKFLIKYWRTLGGAEVDFIIEKPKDLLPVEIKYSSFKSARISRGFRSFLSEYKPKRAIVFTKNFWGDLKINSTSVKFIPVWYL